MYKNLEVDYKIYKECINRTDMVQCGRTKSIIHKQKKPPLNLRKRFIVTSIDCKIFSHNTEKCNDKHSYILVGIGSGPDYFYERHVYRFYYSKFKFLKYYFFMGLSENKDVNKKIYEENEIYNDMIIFSFISSYYNLTSQIVCTFNWVSSNCNKYKWYIHQTSDIYLNVYKINNFLKNYNESKCIIGYILYSCPVTRNKAEAFYIPHNIINSTYYLPYPNGPGYFVHNSAIKEISQKFNISNPKIWIDDAYIGIVISNTNISLIDLKRYFHMFGNIEYSNMKNVFLFHDLSPSEIYVLEKDSLANEGTENRLKLLSNFFTMYNYY